MADEELPQEAEETVAPEEVAPEVVETHEEPEASDEDRVAESLAAELGWAPKEKWRGDEKEFVDAKTFLRNTVDISKANRRELKATREAAERAARAAGAITDQAVARERDRLLRERQDAFDSADVEGFNRADNGLRQLPQQQMPDLPRETREFQQRNAEWYGVDPEATQIAINACQRLANQGVADPETQLAEAEKIVRKRFPEYFEAAKPTKQPGTVEVSGSRATGPSRRGGKSFNDLPGDAKKAAQDFLKRGRIGSLDEYAKFYFEENA